MRLSTLLFSAALAATPSVASAASDIMMHRDPECGCCGKWAAQVSRQLGREARIVDDAGRAAYARRLGVPSGLDSCHTAMVDGMAFEGHVPVADMKRALAQRPRGVRGLAVAGMPLGSPGMEVPGAQSQAYDVVAFGPAGQRVYARHGG